MNARPLPINRENEGEAMPNTTYILLIVLLPLAAFLLLGLFGRKHFNPSSGFIATAFMSVSALLSFYTAYGYFFQYGKVEGVYQKIIVFKYTWLPFSEGMSIDMGAVLDPITAMMLIVVPLVSLMVHIYSLSYLKGEKRFATYYAFLGLFTFSMLGLVLSTNIFQMYFFWELVGVSSFLLIGFYYDKPSAVAACKKAFIVTRFADLGFLIGILVLSFHARSFDFDTIIHNLSARGNSSLAASFLGVSALSWGAALVFIGGAGKSAMFPLHIWLPDAMEGPTPVSALIHAATMVVAGVFLVARLFPIFNISQPVMLLVTYTGAFSALFAAIIACTQTDIKRVLAYSTMSQIGFMMFALGLASAKSNLGFTASMFHLFTHAMFKALLFLGAGAVIHFVHSNEMKDMGGLRKPMPVTHITFLIACLAIAGIPPFAGFFSKEEILLAAFEKNKAVFYVAIFTSALTAFYMFRLYFRIFWNKAAQVPAEHVSHHGSNKHSEGGFAMMMPLIILAAAACGAGFIPFGNFVSADGKALHAPLHFSFSIAPVSLALMGIFTAMWMYKNETGKSQKMAAAFNGFYKAAYRKFYIDEVYMFITQKIIFNLIAKPAAWFDKHVVDGLVNAAADGTGLLSEKIKGLQSGKVQQYAGYFLAGVIVLAALCIYLWK
jgi:NADH-quinone oxidoreductase subunit L